MKRLTIFRTCECNFLTGELLKKSAYEAYAQTKEVRQKFGKAGLIISSHIPETINTAKIIQMVMATSFIKEQPRLSRYHVNCVEAFKTDFLKQVRYNLSHHDHIVLVSHSINISILTELHVYQASSITIEAESWDTIFDLNTSRRSLQEDRLAQEGQSLESIVNTLSKEEKALIASLPYIIG